MHATARAALGSMIGAALAALAAPYTRGWFSVPSVGVGAVTVGHYPKSWDYFVIALLVIGAFAGGTLASWTARPSSEITSEKRPRWVIAALVVFVLMLFVHDHPYAHMDPFHEGEHLTAGWLMKSGERPYRDFFIFHGLATDAGLDALVLGDPPSPRHPRRLQTVLDAATLALLVPIAAEVAATSTGVVLAAHVSLCASAAFWLPVFPYFRLAPVLLAVLGLLRYVRTSRAAPLLLAFAASTLGVLWSLDVGLYAVAGTVAVFLARRVARIDRTPLVRALAVASIAIVLPVIVLLAVRADIRQFLVDSFVVMPKAIDAMWALPATFKTRGDAIRYYLPPVFYGFLLVLALLALRRGDKQRAAQMAIVAIFSILLFRTAAGRVSWSHTRFSMPLLGIAVVAFVLEPLVRLRAVRTTAVAALLAIPLFFYFEIRENLVAGAKLLAGWKGRQSHEGLVAYPFATGKGIYTTAQNAADLAALNGFLETLGPRDATILDFSNERALYYLLQRKPPMRCFDIPMLAAPPLLAEAMAELNAHPPVAVIVSGDPVIASFDGVSNRTRVPELATWIDANYPKRTKIGRFEVATR
jgi:hypothetical protein